MHLEFYCVFFYDGGSSDWTNEHHVHVVSEYNIHMISETIVSDYVKDIIFISIYMD